MPSSDTAVQTGDDRAARCEEHEHEGVEVAAGLNAARSRSSSRRGLTSHHTAAPAGGSRLAPSQTVKPSCNRGRAGKDVGAFYALIGLAIISK